MTRLHRLDASGGDPAGPVTSDTRRAASLSSDSSKAAQPEREADAQSTLLLSASHHAFALQEPVRLLASYVLQLRKACKGDKDQSMTKINQLVACIADRANQIEAGLNELTSALENLCRCELEGKIPQEEQSGVDSKSDC